MTTLMTNNGDAANFIFWICNCNCNCNCKYSFTINTYDAVCTSNTTDADGLDEFAPVLTVSTGNYAGDARIE